jgi:hypothetical protein
MKRLRQKHFYDYEWKKNPNAVYVGRGKGSKWGNPFKVSEYGLEKCLELYEKYLEERLVREPTFLDPLIGKDLVCFCKLDEPCHADVIIKKLLERKSK